MLGRLLVAEARGISRFSVYVLNSAKCEGSFFLLVSCIALDRISLGFVITIPMISVIVDKPFGFVSGRYADEEEIYQGP